MTVMAKKYMADPQAFIFKENEEHERLRALRAAAPAQMEATIGTALDCYPTVVPQDIPLQERPASDYMEAFD